MCLRSRDHSVTLTDIHRHWFLAYHMLACVNCRYRLFRVQIHRGRDIHCVDIIVFNKLLPAGEAMFDIESVSKLIE